MAMKMSGFVDMLCNITGLQSIQKFDAIPRSIINTNAEIPTNHER